MPDLIERATLNKRKKHREAMARDEMREKISFCVTLSQIDEIEDELMGMYVNAEISSAQVGAIKAALESKWRKIRMKLPEFKSVEATISITKNSADELSESELAAYILQSDKETELDNES